ASQLVIPEIGRLRGGPGRFRGLRLMHTHLRGESLTADDLNDLALLRLDLVGMIEVTKDGLPGRVEIAHVLPGSPDENGIGDVDDRSEPFRRIEARSIPDLNLDFGATIRALEQE